MVTRIDKITSNHSGYSIIPEKVVKTLVYTQRKEFDLTEVIKVVNGLQEGS